MSDTDEEFLNNCRTDIDRQINLNSMYAIDEDLPLNNGENFYTILSLYGQYHYDEAKAEKLLIKLFQEEYPQYLLREGDNDACDHEEDNLIKENTEG